jgi:signal transduction histidine kinase
MDKIQNLHSYLKNGAIFIYIATSFMCYAGLIFDSIILYRISIVVIYSNTITILIILLSNVLLVSNAIRLPVSFAAIAYAVIANIIYGFFFVSFNGNHILYFFLNSFFIIYLMVLTYIMVNKINGMIITVIYFVTFLLLTYITHTPFLKETVVLFISVFLAFSTVTYFFVSAFEKSIHEQVVKSSIIEQQNMVVIDTNNLLIERQTHIAEQSEKLAIQKRELARINEELKEVIATKDKFFSIIAHDLKNPFNILIGFSEILYRKYKEYDQDSIFKMIEAIYKSSKNTYNLLENILLWSRMQTGAIKEKPENIDIRSIFEEADKILKNLRSQKQIALTSDFSTETWVFADPFMLNSIVYNLLSNAIKFTHREGRIHISTQTKGKKQLQVCISDNGVGIRPGEIGKLFRIDQSYTTEGTEYEKGTGLGLLLCKEFVERNHGNIWVESSVDSGSRFYFTLRLAFHDSAHKNQSSLV